MPLITGFVLALLAGVTMGLSGWAIKLVRVWKRENFGLSTPLSPYLGIFLLVVAVIAIGTANYYQR